MVSQFSVETVGLGGGGLAFWRQLVDCREEENEEEEEDVDSEEEEEVEPLRLFIGEEAERKLPVVDGQDDSGDWPPLLSLALARETEGDTHFPTALGARVGGGEISTVWTTEATAGVVVKACFLLTRTFLPLLASGVCGPSQTLVNELVVVVELILKWVFDDAWLDTEATPNKGRERSDYEAVVVVIKRRARRSCSIVVREGALL
jgi:hypothetical protein